MLPRRFEDDGESGGDEMEDDILEGVTAVEGATYDDSMS